MWELIVSLSYSDGLYCGLPSEGCSQLGLNAEVYLNLGANQDTALLMPLVNKWLKREQIKTKRRIKASEFIAMVLGSLVYFNKRR